MSCTLILVIKLPAGGDIVYTAWSGETLQENAQLSVCATLAEESIGFLRLRYLRLRSGAAQFTRGRSLGSAGPCIN